MHQEYSLLHRKPPPYFTDFIITLTVTVIWSYGGLKNLLLLQPVLLRITHILDRQRMNSVKILNVCQGKMVQVMSNNYLANNILKMEPKYDLMFSTKANLCIDIVKFLALFYIQNNILNSYSLLQAVVEACQKKQQCRVQPSVGKYDPCPGHPKFIQVDYKCRPCNPQKPWPTTCTVVFIHCFNTPKLSEMKVKLNGMLIVSDTWQVVRHKPSTQANSAHLLTAISKALKYIN
ncbi:hypothetical protein AGLY_013437 [Aphis glycines]|uniref:SUEL-type lectin domain-containing protein n=1 Tax=Aphis glycines TaxID=307491 RepID=A0A6G0T8E8_APHGL|nr:hypothetical protein AGLY_013437 [Aphis glycines]